MFLALSVTILFVYEISLELLNGFATNSYGRRVWSLAETNLNVKVRSKVKVTRDKKRAVHSQHPLSDGVTLSSV